MLEQVSRSQVFLLNTAVVVVPMFCDGHAIVIVILFHSRMTKYAMRRSQPKIFICFFLQFIVINEYYVYIAYLRDKFVPPRAIWRSTCHLHENLLAAFSCIRSKTVFYSSRNFIVSCTIYNWVLDTCGFPCFHFYRELYLSTSQWFNSIKFGRHERDETILNGSYCTKLVLSKPYIVNCDVQPFGLLGTNKGCGLGLVCQKSYFYAFLLSP